MQITHANLLNRADYSAVTQIEDACSRELDEAEQEYLAAYEHYKNAVNKHDRAWKCAEFLYAKARYYEKFAAYADFVEGF